MVNLRAFRRSITVRNRHRVVNVGHPQIEHVGYQPPEGKAGEVEAHRVSEMVDRVGAEEFVGLQRLEFHALLVVTQGHERHMVDFADHDLGPGSVLWLRPGQVQAWGDTTAFDGHVLIWPAGLVDPAVDRLVGVESAYGPREWNLSAEAREEIEPLLAMLDRLSPDESMPRELRSATLAHLLETLLLRLAAHAGATGTVEALPEPFVAFREMVEARHAEWHDVREYAAALGWSARTLARATARAAGVTPKRMIDDRILLEARRLLAHTHQPVHRVGSRLGFDDPSNFTAWFAHRAGVRPSEFRARMRR